MPIPTSISDLSATPGSNSPSGSDSPTEGDNYIRALSAIIRQTYDSYADTASTAAGDALIAVKRSGTSAVATTLHDWIERQWITPQDFGAVGDGVTDDTAAFQAALLASQFVFIPAGTYLLSSVLEIDNDQTICGAGSYATILINNTTDGIKLKANSRTNGNNFKIKGITFTKTFASGSTAKAFDMSNVSFSKLEDINAENFYVAVYFTRDPGSKECWYNHIEGGQFKECAFGIWIDDSISSQSVNGILCSHLTMTNWDYLWVTALPALNTSGFRYSGYGNTLTNSYVQGFKRHIWREQVGGANVFSGVYLESAVTVGESIYFPYGAYFGNVDYWEGGHGDGFDIEDGIYDPYGGLVFRNILNTKPVIAGTVSNGSEKLTNGSFTSTTTGWTVSNGTLSSVAGGFSGNCLQLTQTSGSTAYASQTFTAVVGARYRLTFYHKNGTFTGRVLVGNGVTGSECGSITTLNDASWTKYTLFFTAQATTTYINFVCPGATQNTLFDEASLIQVALGSAGDISTSGTLDAGGVVVSALPTYANNAAAKAGGLLPGQLYRVNAAIDPEPIYVVHD